MNKWFAVALVALLSACGARLDGTYSDAAGLANYTFKKLSVNNVDGQLDLAERDDCRSDVVERDEAALQLFVPDEQLAEAVEPTVANLDNPAPRLLRWVSPLCLGLCTATHDVRDVAMRLDDLQRAPAAIAVVGAKVLAASNAWRLALDHDRAKHLFELRDVMSIRSGHDERQRDATAVHKQVSLAPLFSPDPSGWVRRPLAPAAP